MAAAFLKGAEALAEKNGIKLDVGEVKTVREYINAPKGDGEGEGPEVQPIELASRFVAHIAHRTPVIKKLKKRAEGKDKKAGIVSDFLGLVVQIAARNEDLITEAATDAVSSVVSRGGQDQTQPSQHVEFGSVTPISQPQIIQED